MEVIDGQWSTANQDAAHNALLKKNFFLERHAKLHQKNLQNSEAAKGEPCYSKEPLYIRPGLMLCSL